jgi:hypothetical protein
MASPEVVDLPEAGGFELSARGRPLFGRLIPVRLALPPPPPRPRGDGRYLMGPDSLATTVPRPQGDGLLWHEARTRMGSLTKRELK